MGLTYTKVLEIPTGTSYVKKALYSVAFDDSYPTGGEAVTPSSVGVKSVLAASVVENNTGYIIQFDRANCKLKAYTTLSEPEVLVAFHNVTTAEANAGHTVIDAEAGKTIRVLGFSVTARGGAVGGATTVDLQDTADSPVTIAAIAIAALTQDEAVCEGSASVAGGAGIGGAALTASKGVRLIKGGSDITTATSFDVVIFYSRTDTPTGALAELANTSSALNGLSVVIEVVGAEG